MSTHDPLTTALGQALRERSDDVHGSHLSLDDVRGRARGIRRRRAAAGTGAVAALVAAVLVTPALLGGGPRQGPPDPAPAPTPPSATATPTDDPTADATRSGPAAGVLDVSHLPTGAPPALDYLEDGRLHFGEGGSGEVRTRYTPRAFVEMSDGSRVWQTSDQGAPYVEIQDADGGFHDPLVAGWGLAVNPTRSAVAWVETTGQVVLWEARATDPRPLGDPVPPFEPTPVSVVGEGVGAGGGSGPGCKVTACTVVVNVGGSDPRPWEVSDTGTARLLDGGFRRVNDTSQSGLTTGLTKVLDTGTCSALLGAGEFQGFSTCRDQLSAISGDGRLVLAYPSQVDGLGPAGIAVYSVTGKRLFARAATEEAQSHLGDAVWEDHGHLLVPAYQDGSWSLVRIGADGAMEYAVPPVRGSDVTSPFVLPTGGAPVVG